MARPDKTLMIMVLLQPLEIMAAVVVPVRAEDRPRRPRMSTAPRRPRRPSEAVAAVVVVVEMVATVGTASMVRLGVMGEHPARVVLAVQP
jgi:hypothetical protein